MILYEDGVLIDYLQGKVAPIFKNTTLPIGSSRIHYGFINYEKIYILNMNQKVKVVNMNNRGFNLLNSEPPFDFEGYEMKRDRYGSGIATMDHYWIVGLSFYSQFRNKYFSLQKSLIPHETLNLMF